MRLSGRIHNVFKPRAHLASFTSAHAVSPLTVRSPAAPGHVPCCADVVTAQSLGSVSAAHRCLRSLPRDRGWAAERDAWVHIDRRWVPGLGPTVTASSANGPVGTVRSGAQDGSAVGIPRGSAVVEPQWMETDERPLSPCPGTGQRFLGELVRHGCRSDSLGKIATPVVALDEHPSRIPESRGQPSVPYVRDEEGNVACLGHDRHGGAALPLQILVGEPLQGRCLS